jgi:hypothetical protein
MSLPRTLVTELRIALEDYLEADLAYFAHTWEGDDDQYQELVERHLKVEQYLTWRRCRALLRQAPEGFWDPEVARHLRYFGPHPLYGTFTRLLIGHLSRIEDST